MDLGNLTASQNFTMEQRLGAIGMRVSADELSPSLVAQIDIEATLADALIECALDEYFLRFLGPLFSWIKEHGQCVIVEKLIKLITLRKKEGSPVHFAALAGCFALHEGLRRWVALARFSPPVGEECLVGPPELALSLLELRGREPWSEDSGVLLPKGIIDTREKWVLSKEELSNVNRQYHNRLIYGPQWRADIITAVEQGASTAAEVSQLTGADDENCQRVLAELAAAGKISRMTKAE